MRCLGPDVWEAIVAPISLGSRARAVRLALLAARRSSKRSVSLLQSVTSNAHHRGVLVLTFTRIKASNLPLAISLSFFSNHHPYKRREATTEDISHRSDMPGSASLLWTVRTMCWREKQRPQRSGCRYGIASLFWNIPVPFSQDAPFIVIGNRWLGGACRMIRKLVRSCRRGAIGGNLFRPRGGRVWRVADNIGRTHPYFPGGNARAAN